MRNNVSLSIEDYKKKRRGGANSFALALAIQGVDTIELVELFVDVVAKEYPDKRFIIQYDGGIYSIMVKCDNNILYEGNVVEIEKMLQEGKYVFRDKMREKMKQIY